ncbi:MAG: type V CRISPR-associated protein Cas12a/Cpf1 [Clostridia bacterium]|nr:type V CRISPR-associated protein Cas12a/Cpf1 [Clostridia bacterium]
MLNSFTNLYSLSKTLRFQLIPIGKTEDTFQGKNLLAQDEERAKNYQLVKGYMDEFHKAFIQRILSKTVLLDLDAYAALYYTPNKSEKDKAAMEKMEAAFRKQIAKAFHADPIYKQLNKKEFVRELLPAFLASRHDKERQKIVEGFYQFTTYFTGFFQNRENMYSDEAKATSIANRCINENLPRFLDNAKSFEKVFAELPVSDITELNQTFEGLLGYSVDYVFRPDHFSFFLSQSGIDTYNSVLGGYTTSDGTKVQGINEKVNLFNQQLKKEDRNLRLPVLKPLYKQILSDRDSYSFVAEAFETDQAVLDSVQTFYAETVEETLHGVSALFGDLSSFDPAGIFVQNGLAFTDLSQQVFGSWDILPRAWNEKYESEHPIGKKNPETYFEVESKARKAIKSFSVAELQMLGNSSDCEQKGNIAQWLQVAAEERITAVRDAYAKAQALLMQPYKAEKKLALNVSAVESIKTLLDAVKALEWLLKPLCGSGKETNKDEVFYGKFLPLFDALAQIDRLYDRVRNYLTKKPYSKDKIKLNFENPQFLNGWDRNKETDYRCVLLRKDGKYYLAVMDKTAPKVFEATPEAQGEPCYEKIEYKLLPGPNKMLPKVFFANSNIAFFAPSDEILSIRQRESFKKGEAFSLRDCHAMIDFYKESIAKHPEWNQYGFRFRPTAEYSDIGAFYRDVKDQGYKIRFVKVPDSYINAKVEDGSLYLFQIYNKDFSPHSHGKSNLHTLYFKMLFDERNLADVVYKLNGEAEMFFRYPSISEKEKIVHHANQPIQNKNPDNAKATSTFTYDIVKDERFTKPMFSLHIPISMNFKSDDFALLNDRVRRAIREKGEQYIIGIDRGERNLIYVCVINGKGEIVEQLSLNEIVSDNDHRVNYHDLLDRKEKARDEARKSWSTVETIKELKEGYMSQVVHKLCELVVKYDAVIALEDLNSGFKNSRVKVEKQVYQKFEKALIDKLNYLVTSKDPADAEQPGGLLHAYQLTNKADKTAHGLQNGILFYVPAWLTSKIDPVTGFVDLLKPRYQSVHQAQDFFSRFTSVRYHAQEDLFAFTFDYANFPRCGADARRVWTVWTNGERIRTFRDKQSGQFVNETVQLTAAFRALFEKYGFNLEEDLLPQIVANNDAAFHRELMRLFALTLQMRNSETGNVNVDYLISPVKGVDGTFFDSRDYKGQTALLPADADANGAFNIARKALWATEQIRAAAEGEERDVKLAVSNSDWLAFAQGV